MDTLRRLLMSTFYHSLGIAQVYNTVHDMNRQLMTLSPDDARRAKRKFRKLWRKAAKKKTSYPEADVARRSRTGLGVQVPTKRNKLNRKLEVMLSVRTRVESMLCDTDSFHGEVSSVGS